MKLVVVIVNYKTPDMTLDAARAAIKELAFLQGAWSLIIVDNFSDDGSVEALRRGIAAEREVKPEDWGKVLIVESKVNGGFGAGNNLGIKAASCSNTAPEYFYLLNSDAFPEEGSIKPLIQQLDHSTVAGIAGSFIRGTDGEPHVTAFRFPTILGELEGAIRLGLVSRLLKNFAVPIGIPGTTQSVDWVAGASMLIRRKVLEDVGLFDENYFLYFEETDLCYRAKKAGWSTIYVKESVVSHIGSVSTGRKTWGRVPYYWLDSRRHYFIKNHGKSYYYLATITRLFGEIGWRVRAKLQRKKTEDLQGFLPDLARHFFSTYKPKDPA